MRWLAVVVTAMLLVSGCTTTDSSPGALPGGDLGDPPASSGVVDEPDCTVPSRLRGAEVTRLQIDDDQVALTFDAGANADGVASILQTLADEGVRGTFFLKGEFVETYPKKSARIAGAHLVGNHTMTHPHLPGLTRKRVRHEVRRAQRVITAIAGEDPRRFFRFPYGDRDSRTIRIVNNLCYVPFRWTVDTLGWQGTGDGGTAENVVDRVLEAAEPGMVVLMHVGSNPDDGSTLDADALPDVIEGLRDLGYSFVTLARVLRPAP
jgi:peptidoglycan/xylan/chitin deacetylase (PgdA/CDA1 family)